MVRSAKILALTAIVLLLAVKAEAQQSQTAAAPADRCEGTLCDLYYASHGSAAQPTAKPVSTTPGIPPGATPLMAPTGNYFTSLFSGGSSSGNASAPGATTRPPPPESEPASASNSYMHLGTNGLLGDHKGPCSGTLCDLYYHGSGDEAAGQQQASADAGAPAAAEPPPVPHRHIVHESETRPKCSSPAADPWRCFR